MSTTDSVAEVTGNDAPVRPGRLLAEAREQRNQTVADIAQQLKLSPSQIEALESDAYEKLPGPIFVRGFIRNYAKLVGLDGERLVTALAGTRTELPVVAAVPHSDNIPFPAGHRPRWPVIIGVLGVIIAALLLFDFMISPSPVPVKDVPVAIAPVVSPPSVSSAPAVTEPVTTALTPAASAPAVTEPVSQAVASAGAQAVPSLPGAPGNRNLQLTFEADSWVEIRDRNDRVVFSQLNRAGTTQQVQGRAPLNVIIGNARGVRLLQDGRAFDLAPHTRVEVARFTIK